MSDKESNFSFIFFFRIPSSNDFRSMSISVKTRVFFFGVCLLYLFYTLCGSGLFLLLESIDFRLFVEMVVGVGWVVIEAGARSCFVEICDEHPIGVGIYNFYCLNSGLHFCPSLLYPPSLVVQMSL